MRKIAALVISFALSSSVANSSYSLQNYPSQALHADVLVQGGEVIDGTGSEAAKLDIAIEGDHIVFVGNSVKSKITAARTIKANGLVVAPGFFDDPHWEQTPKRSFIKVVPW